MSTTQTRRRKVKRHRLTGEHEDYCFRLPSADLEAMDATSEARGMSIAEAMRQAVKLFLAVNMNMSHVHYPSESGNGR